MSQLEFEDFLASDSYQSVSSLTRQIKTLLETSFPGVWIQGEISNLTSHTSGHLYFSLKDKNAQISCVMWRSRRKDLFFAPQEGMKVLAKARLGLYEPRGIYQLDVWQMQPDGIGELQLAFEQLKVRLNEEGLFAQECKQPLPEFPECIGVVTSPTGAAIKDILTVLRRRFPSVRIVLNPVRVQGEGAAREIASAIDQFNEFGQIDLMIVGRGGGPIEDLWAFNEEIVARAIFRSKIPVVSAVGHEIDFTISDFVADVRAETPSAAAETVVCRRQDLVTQLNYFRQSMADLLLEQIKFERLRLHGLRRSYAFGQPVDQVSQANQRLDELSRFLIKAIMIKIDSSHEILNSLMTRLSSVNHEKVLQRGYAVCSRVDNGEHVIGRHGLAADDKLRIEFHDGKVGATIDSVLS